ncbi:MAG TPA: beta-ketoacyl synthase N-terminal-like domain-containing protein, partial [Solirubrobacterales bacterium]|nr:beta-ketoacyl synthase N-terminal-like domain-containing protein [Solirubrobacterales bacterium]
MGWFRVSVGERAVVESSLIAVVGVSCRLPRAPDPGAFWSLLSAGQQAVGEIPTERWEMASRPFEEGLYETDPGARFGAFLERVDHFDPVFFGISAPEAEAMDPQQRLILELGWEALEDARMNPGGLREESAGIFLGAIASDYSDLIQRRGPDAISPHTLTGLHRSIIANRVSHILGLRGPSLTVDAAQSSSLLAVHLACESLRKGEVSVALAGGVHLNIDPHSALGASRLGALSPDGRCFAFDARANGFVRGEGGGVLVLKPFASARADGDHVYCLIRAGAVNNDGSTEGLTRPSQAAQQSLLREAYERAGLVGSEVQYVELHGTGTPVGDPIEAAALGAVLGAGRAAEEHLVVGSAKTNIGHLEGAAGVAGLIKAALAIENRRLPASLNFKTPNPEIPLDELGLRVQRDLGDWPHPDRTLIAGVSSFGIGGTNCHLVLSEAPEGERVRTGQGKSPGRGAAPLPTPIPLVLSAKTGPALAQAAARLGAHLKASPDQDLTDLAYSLTATRPSFEHRAVAIGRDSGELLGALGAIEREKPSPGAISAKGKAGKLAYLFTGQGSQRIGMAKELHAAYPVFAETLEQACE